jgi:hypothetical protein
VLDPQFVADCPYAAEAILFDEILELDRDAGRLVARMPTHDRLPLTDLQRAHPVRHPRQVEGQAGGRREAAAGAGSACPASA